MGIFQATVYGLVQGLTEFLPVSSSAHLILVPVFTDWPDPGLAFDVALHWGTLIAILIYFRKDILVLIAGGLGALGGGRTHENLLPWKIVAATIPGAIFGVLIEHKAETVFRSPWILVGTLSVMGLVLWFADKTGKKSIRLEDITWRHAIIVGVLQALALIPGVSRSGITITACLFLGLEREAAVRFSFLLALPITAGAGLLKCSYLLHNAGDVGVWVAMAVSALSGVAAIHVLITYVRTRSFTPFVVYRLLLAAAVAVLMMVRG